MYFRNIALLSQNDVKSHHFNLAEPLKSLNLSVNLNYVGKTQGITSRYLFSSVVRLNVASTCFTPKITQTIKAPTFSMILVG